ncbi:MAG: hypothetical protein ABI696_16505 [Rubrivivax sp.]
MPRNGADALPRDAAAAGRRTAGVGVRTPLIDGVEKVTGRARYTADLPLGPALVGRILRSPVAHLRDLSSALQNNPLECAAVDR